MSATFQFSYIIFELSDNLRVFLINKRKKKKAVLPPLGRNLLPGLPHRATETLTNKEIVYKNN